MLRRRKVRTEPRLGDVVKIKKDAILGRKIVCVGSHAKDKSLIRSLSDIESFFIKSASSQFGKEVVEAIPIEFGVPYRKERNVFFNIFLRKRYSVLLNVNSLNIVKTFNEEEVGGLNSWIKDEARYSYPPEEIRRIFYGGV